MLVNVAGVCPGANVYGWSFKENKYVLDQAAVRLMHLCFLPLEKLKMSDSKRER